MKIETDDIDDLPIPSITKEDIELFTARIMKHDIERTIAATIGKAAPTKWEKLTQEQIYQDIKFAMKNTDWRPEMTFEELKREAQKATGRDRLGATACSLIAEILNTQAQIDEARATVMMAHQVAQHAGARLRLGLKFSMLLNVAGLAWLAALTLLKVAP